MPALHWLVSLMIVAQQDRVAARPDVRCGSFCLQVALDALGDPVAFSDLEAGLKKPTDRGYSLAQLQDEARKRGLHAAAVSTKLENLAARNETFACVAMMKDNHFLLVYDIDPSSQDIFVVDPPREYILPVDTFLASWTGNALLLSKGDIETEEMLTARLGALRMRTNFLKVLGGLAATWALFILVGRFRRSRALATSCILMAVTSTSLGCNDRPGTLIPPTAIAVETVRYPLEVTPLSHDLGEIVKDNPDQMLDVSTTLVNRSHSPLRIKELRPSCGCTQPRLGRLELQPAESTTLSAGIVVGDSPEERSSSIQIFTDPPTDSPCRVVFRWKAVLPLRTVPSSLTDTSLAIGERRSKSLAISVKNLRLCDRCTIVADSTDPAIACAVRLAEGPRQAEGLHSSPDANPLEVGSMQVEYGGPLEQGTRQSPISLRIVCRGADVARCDVPLTLGVSPILEVSPSRLFLGLLDSGSDARGVIVLRSPFGKPFRITGVREEGRAEGDRSPLRMDFEGKAADSCVLKVQVTTPAAAGPWRSTVVVDTDLAEMSQVKVPVSCVVRGVVH